MCCVWTGTLTEVASAFRAIGKTSGCRVGRCGGQRSFTGLSAGGSVKVSAEEEGDRGHHCTTWPAWERSCSLFPTMLKVNKTFSFCIFIQRCLYGVFFILIYLFILFRVFVAVLSLIRLYRTTAVHKPCFTSWTHIWVCTSVIPQEYNTE